MARKLDDIMAALLPKRRSRINDRAMELATLKDLRKAAEQTQEDLAAALGVGQDTISRLEKRSDMLHDSAESCSRTFYSGFCIIFG